MPTNIPPIDPSAPLPTRVGIENEANNITPREMADHLQQWLHATSGPVGEIEFDVFEGQLHHLVDPQGNVWKAKFDSSCDAEMNTPPLSTFGQLMQAKRAIGSLKNLRLPPRTPYERPRAPTFEANTGMHLHFELIHLQPRQAVTWLALLHRHQPLIYRAFHVFTPRLRYCAPLESARVGAVIDRPPETLEGLANAFGWMNAERDRFINFKNLVDEGMGTGEIRCFNGTSDASQVSLAVGLGMRAYEIAAASNGVTPSEWRTPIDDEHAFAADFVLDAGHELLRGILSEAARPPSYDEQVINDPTCFRNFPEAARDTFRTARLAVSARGENLADVGPTQAHNPEIVWVACVQNGQAMASALPHFKSGRTFAFDLAGHAPDILPHLDDHLRNDFDVVFRAFMEGAPSVLGDAGSRLRGNCRAMSIFAQQFGGALQYTLLSAEETLELAVTVIQEDSDWASFLPPAFVLNVPFLRALLQRVPSAYGGLTPAQCEVLGITHQPVYA